VSPQQPRRIALLLEYDGSPFAGSQVQKQNPSVQEALEAAVEQLTGEHARAAFAGRTDAGVHALGQVAAFTTASRLKTESFVHGLNAWLPESIAVQRAAEVDLAFDPRREASRRWYRYLVYNSPTRSPLWRGRAWQVAAPLDAARMARAARWLDGEHDFAAFSRREPTSTVRRVFRCDVRAEPPLIVFDMEATAFLRQQVRRTVGTLVQVGRSKLGVSDFRSLLRRAEPSSAGPVAPAGGLYLMRVAYPSLDLGGPMR
jgi:tRNA pseudouridine38-40 synthase